MTRRWMQWLAPALMAAVLTSPVLAQSVVTDPGRGREIAESLCSTCHIVDASPGTSPSPTFPAFTLSLTSPINLKSV